MTTDMRLDDSHIGISASLSADMAMLGLTPTHLDDAMAEIARHLLAQGAHLIYGGDLRQGGFSRLLFELVARHRRDGPGEDEAVGVTNYLAWPVHIGMSADTIAEATADLEGTAELVCLAPDGTPVDLAERLAMPTHVPDAGEWDHGLTEMRRTITSRTQARIVIGGQVANFKGRMPGIAQEALFALEARQPLYILGGFGGCARDIAVSLGVDADERPKASWPGHASFDVYGPEDLANGLSAEENAVLVRTPHVDQAMALLLRGLLCLHRDATKAAPVASQGGAPPDPEPA